MISLALRLRLASASALAVLAVSLVAVPFAPAAEPLEVFYASKDKEGTKRSAYPPGVGGFEGPCGLALDPAGNLYVSDYYRGDVDVFGLSLSYLTQVANLDPLDGPCGLAAAASGALYVNDYHRAVLRFAPNALPVQAGTSYGAATTIDPGPATGVALDPVTGRLYVNERDRIAVYEASGAPAEVGGEPLLIGGGSLEDGYGLAVSQFPGTQGRLYVADAAANAVKVYDPSLDTEDPVAVIDGTGTPNGEFTSLRDSALAVDRVTGRLYVSDDLQPEGFDAPEATIRAFNANGSYAGHLPTNVLDARPPGLAVDNSTRSTQGRVYVTSGNTADAGVYVYPPNATVGVPPACAPGGACPGKPAAGGGGGSALRAALAAPVTTPAPLPQRSGVGGGTIVQRGTLRVSMSGALAPYRLPRSTLAPVAVSVTGRVSTTDGTAPPRLQALRIELNRHGRLDRAGLPTCPVKRIHPASTSRALAACRSALVGEGSFEAEITLGGQEPYPTQGRLLVFNGIRHGKPVLLGQIYSPRPFATSFVIVFTINRIAHGTYGTALIAALPDALGSWGNLTAIEMRLSRRFSLGGRRHSYVSASCPAPQGFPGATFPLARTSFRFEGVGTLSSTLNESCGVR